MENEFGYKASDIEVLKGLDPVRKRPGMFIGGTDRDSLHRLISEILDNAVDEALSGFCNKIEVLMNRDGSVSVIDNGRGIPVDTHEAEGIPAVELIMTTLHAGGKFNSKTYKTSAGLHGVGASVVNALSDWLEVRVWRNNKEYHIKFCDGVTSEPLSVVKEGIDRSGTMVTFMPSNKVFSDINFDFAVIEKRIREIAFLNAGLELSLKDLRSEFDRSINFKFDGGIVDFVSYLDKAKTPLHKTIYISEKDPESDIIVEVAMQWNNSYYENIMCFTNNVMQSDGGTHMAGFRSGITRTINNYVAATKKEKYDIESEDTREGLTAVVSIKMSDPQFSSQTKEKLVNSNVKSIVDNMLSKNLTRWSEENPNSIKHVINKVIDAVRAREALQKAKLLNRKKSSLGSTLLGKLANCREKKPEVCELFLVEGDSAAGTAKQGRDRETQAILPLRGKILNSERARLDQVLGFSEIVTMINALGAGIGDEFDITKLRYHKVILMTDADVDGSHIRTLLMTFFYRYMPKIIENGHLYIAQPPLYKVRHGKDDIYMNDDKDLYNHLIKNVIEKSVLKSQNGEVYEGEMLHTLIADLLKYTNILARYNASLQEVVEAISMSDKFVHSIGDNIDHIEVANEVLSKLNQIQLSDGESNGITWTYEFKESDCIFTKKSQLFKLSQRVNLNQIYEFMNKTNLLTIASRISKIFREQVLLVIDDVSHIFNLPSNLISHIMSSVKKGMYIQRFKGLGEMNPDQLWDTTLNPASRVLKQVKVNAVQSADDVFATLMGDAVEPRREFIKNNAIAVQSLDV